MANPANPQHEAIAGVFDRAASTYDRVGPQFFTHFGQWLVECAVLSAGAEVLDVAAGRGATLFAAAEKVGASGKVRGIDLSADMVRETVADIRNAGWRHATMQQMDATQLDFPQGAFDRVLCGFAVFFFPRPRLALDEFFRVLRPGGRVAVTTWAENCPFLTWLRRELTASSPPQAPSAAGSPETLCFDTPARLEAALMQAGFVDIHVSMEEADFVYAHEDEWWLSLWSHGIRQRLERLEPRVLAQVKADMLHKVQSLKQADGIHNVYRAHCAVGTKPGP